MLPTADAGNFKRITIDGNFDDWIGIPVAMDDEVDEEGMFDIRDVAIANDEAFIYVKARLHSPADYASFNHQVVLDGDGDTFTSLQWVGLGFEMMIENGSGFQQKNGAFNEGGVSQLDWSTAPSGNVSQIGYGRSFRRTIVGRAATAFSGSGLGPEVYPVVTVPLTAGRTTYYSRTSFEWD